MQELMDAVREQQATGRKISEISITTSYIQQCLDENPIPNQAIETIKTFMGIPVKVDDDVNKFEILLESR